MIDLSTESEVKVPSLQSSATSNIIIIDARRPDEYMIGKTNDDLKTSANELSSMFTNSIPKKNGEKIRMSDKVIQPIKRNATEQCLIELKFYDFKIC